MMRFAIGDRVRPTAAYLKRGRPDRRFEADKGTVVPPPGRDWAPGTRYMDTETTMDGCYVDWDNGPHTYMSDLDIEPLTVVERLAELDR